MLAKDAGRRLVHTLKYEQGAWLARDMARIIATTPGFPEFLAGAILVPVPLHPRKLQVRGYNQARLVAKNLARLLPSLSVLPLLVRVQDTPTQTQLDREERSRNVKNAFALRPGATVDTAARHVVFDDVFTTGATLNACCAVLKAAGVENLDVATFAHG